MPAEACESAPPSPSFGTMASMLSKKSTHGAARRARLNTLRSAFSDSPSHFENSCGPSTAMSGNPVSPASARAGRAGEQNPPRRFESDLLVELVACVSVLDNRAQQALGIVESAHGVEAERAFLEKEFARGARLDFAQALPEIVGGHHEAAEIHRARFAG